MYNSKNLCIVSIMPYTWEVSEENWLVIHFANLHLKVDYKNRELAMARYSAALNGGIVFT